LLQNWDLTGQITWRNEENIINGKFSNITAKFVPYVDFRI